MDCILVRVPIHRERQASLRFDMLAALVEVT